MLVQEKEGEFLFNIIFFPSVSWTFTMCMWACWCTCSTLLSQDCTFTVWWLKGVQLHIILVQVRDKNVEAELNRLTHSCILNWCVHTRVRLECVSISVEQRSTGHGIKGLHLKISSIDLSEVRERRFTLNLFWERGTDLNVNCCPAGSVLCNTWVTWK